MTTDTRLWRLRVYVDSDGPCRSLVECLRFMGAASISQCNDGQLAVDIVPPRVVAPGHSRAWAQRNADRMRTFGLDAEALPPPWEVEQCEL